ncbi:transposase, IS4 family [Micromonospora rhizosphaerae]|uniref:Transposase, IS4 family n=1 Tax=Micromonospora rhizosphaerae TaxID=568872 RepID=A0A1C6ST41_9ACTN|nr:IS4 family transposase [Micromonospora rhizosphaerae]SCL32637.1 transposase, IS4 family [Micromonospora rhizosphaerae]
MVAAGRFAPGHLGELTQLVPFEMVDDALDRTGAVQSRVRLLPARVVVYLLLAGCLFAELGYVQVWHRLTAGLHGLAVATPTASALRQARQRLGATPLRALFDLLRGPAATTAAGAVSWRGLLVCAVDGTLMSVADSAANLTAVVKQRCNHGAGGYPTVRVLALVACGTRSVIDAVFGPASTGEPGYAARLAGSLRPGMLLLADRNFAAADLLTHLATTGADLLVRCKTGRRLPVRSRYPDGSYLSQLGSLAVRVIEAEISIVTSAGRRTGTYRLVTTLLDPHRYPAGELITLYHQRWEIETVYLELKSTILGGRVLRARTPAGIDQEIYALLVTYQVLRTAMTDATDTIPGLDPDRASFTIALHTARDQVIQAASIIADTVIDLVGAIGRRVLATLMPDRRVRTKPRIVKRAISKYNARGPDIDRTTYKATIEINILDTGP